MQRKCSPQQCQSKLESSRNRYWEQEVNVSSWLRSSQQKLCRENKSSLTDSPSTTKTFVSCNSTCIPSRTQFHVCCFTRARGAPEDPHSVFPFFSGNMKACEYFGVMMPSVSTIVMGHDCVINVKTGTADSVKRVQKNCPNSRIRQNGTEPCHADFPPCNAEGWLTTGASAQFHSILCSDSRELPGLSRRWCRLLRFWVWDRGRNECFDH